MSGSLVWADWDDDAPIRQGDLVRRPAARSPSKPVWGLVVTADCDILQKKAGERFTWVRIVTGRDYLGSRWAPEQLRRFVERQGRVAADGASAHLRKNHPELDPLTPDKLLTWLAESDPSDIWSTIAPERPEDPKLLRTMRALKVAHAENVDDSPLDRLREVWTSVGRAAVDQAAALRDAFTGDRGFPDFFLLPDMPDTDGYGFVALLREIESIDAGDVFGSEREARLADRPDAFHRFARLHDGLRFAVSQKLAFLFSRIGLPASYERACESAADLLVQQSGYQEQAA